MAGLQALLRPPRLLRAWAAEAVEAKRVAREILCRTLFLTDNPEFATCLKPVATLRLLPQAPLAWAEGREV